MNTRWLTILGIGEDGVEALPATARGLIASAGLVVGGARHLALAAPLITGETLPWPRPIETALPEILARRGTPVVVLASGDPFCFGIGPLLARAVPNEEFLCVPAPSSLSLAAARLGWALQDCMVISCCGRPIEALIPRLQPGARILALSADATTPAAIAALLCRQGFGPSRMQVLESLGGPGERRRDAMAESFALEGIAALNLVAIEAVPGTDARILPLTAGLPDAYFEHDGQITKQEIRALTLAALAPRQGELLWDIGCGSGSIGIEWMLRHASNHTIAIESRPDRAARAARNAAALGVPGWELRPGRAPEALAGLPAPHAVFIGGGAQNPAVLETGWNRLQPGGRMVVNGVTAETQAQLLAAHARLGGRLTRIAIERLEPLGGQHVFRPALPIVQWAATRP